ncbi:MAG: glycine dehydrogenase subunit 2 [Erysipelotrichaceae bacterium]|nr:MAG: glycine dehydrogenase subunit [Erysipelotrichaceae bacterium]TXT18860.1 MAG: glycine dehydrogenase subunit 2 [Erysipelotrichaceae bacterium]
MSALIFERSIKNRRGITLPEFDCPEVHLDENIVRAAAPRLAQVGEVDVVRHYMELSRNAFGVDNGFYPLGSCTMKYNPKLNEQTASLPGFSDIHPLQSPDSVKGALRLMSELSQQLCEVTGMDGFTLQPSAGAHGEFTGLLLIHAYHEDRKDVKRSKVIVPDSAHGTNPASANMAGYSIINVPSNAEGGVDVEALRSVLSDEVAALMLTNPNTLGLFDPNIEEIAKMVHEAGGLVYYDGANLNAIMGEVRPGDMGFDVVHLNLHKTFSTPHGGGGPGSGPVGVKAHLLPYLPDGTVVKEKFIANEKSIGRLRSFYGNFLVNVRAYTYILSLGSNGLKEASYNAVLNANYMMAKLKDHFPVAYPVPCMHEFVLSLQKLKDETGVNAKDMCKGLLDYKVHPPTMYFPLIVHEALMIEPTETESKETMDEFIRILIELKDKAYTDPEYLHNAPYTTPIKRVDDVLAARHPVLKAVL